MGLSTQGTVHDYELLKIELDWYKGQTDWFEDLEIFVDLGYKGMEEDFETKKLHIPHRRPRKTKKNPNPELTEKQREHNKSVSQTRILVEHAIGSMKFFKILTDNYRNRRCGFEDLSVEICAGLHNLKIRPPTN